MMTPDSSSLAELIENGNVAYNESDFKKAIEYYEQALEIAKDTGDKLSEERCLGSLGNAYSNLGEVKKAIEYYEQALEIARDTGDMQGEESWLLGGLGRTYRNLGEVKKAIKYYEQALEIARDTGDMQGEESWLLCGLGDAYSDLGEVKKSIEYYEQALKIVRDTGDIRGEGNCLCGLGYSYGDLGEVKKAIEYYEQALKIARDSGNRWGEGSCLCGLGNAYSSLGEVKKAIEYYEQALKIARDHGDKMTEGSCLGGLGNAYSNLGEVKKAIEYYEQALKIARDTWDRLGEGRWLGDLGLAYSDLGEVKKAIEYYEQALEIARDDGDKLAEGIWISNLGEVDLVSGDWASAAELFREALGLYERSGYLTRQAEVLSLMGELQIRSGDWESARENLGRARVIYEGTTPPEIAGVLVAISELNILENSFDRANADLQQALELVSGSEQVPKMIKIFNKLGRAKLVEYEMQGEMGSVSKAKVYLEEALRLAGNILPQEQGISWRYLGIVYSNNGQKDESLNCFDRSVGILQQINARYELAKTYFEFARVLAKNDEARRSEEMAKVCAFECLHKNFKELEIDTYVLLGDIVREKDNSQFGYYLDAFKTAKFNPRIYVKIFFILITRMKRMDRENLNNFIQSLQDINNEIHINSFLQSLSLKIEGKEYSTEELPHELIEELSSFDVPADQRN